MRKRHLSSKTWAVGLLAALGLCGSATAQEAGLRVESADHRIELVDSRELPYTRVKGVTVRQHVLRVTDRPSGESRQLLFGGPEKGVRGELESLRIFGRRVAATTATDLAIFDLPSGRLEHLGRCHDPTISESARWVAYKAFQPRFTPPEASTHVVMVLDVSSLEAAAVFPERETISKGPHGEPRAWVEDPASRAQVGKLFWGPGEERLLFFAKRRRSEEGPREAVDSSVLVDLDKGVERSTFRQQEILRDVYLKPGARVDGSRVLFNVGDVRWLDEEVVEIVPPSGYWWMNERFTLDLGSRAQAGTTNG